MAMSNAQRQAAHRARKKQRNDRNGIKQILPVTEHRNGRDYYDANGVEHIFIGNFGFGDLYASVVPCHCEGRHTS